MTRARRPSRGKFSPNRATTPRGTRLRVLVNWTDAPNPSPDEILRLTQLAQILRNAEGITYYEGPGTLIAWPPGETPRIRLPGGALIYGCECWWTWMERGQRRAMSRRAVVRGRTQ